MASKKHKWDEKLKPHYKNVLIAGIILLALTFLFGQNIKYLIIVPLLIGIASISTFYQNFFRSPINFELIKLATIVTSATYGMATGISVGVISTVASKIISEKLDHTAIFSLIAIVAVAIAAGIFSDASIVTLGIALVIVYHLMTVPFQLALGGNWVYGSIYVGTNIIFNILIFTRLAHFLVKVM